MASSPKIRFLSVFLFLMSTRVFPLQFGAGNSLLISPSPSANGMGLCYGPLFSDEPMAVIFNPAAAGLFVQENKFGVSIFTNDANWPIVGYGNWPYNAWVLACSFDVFRDSTVPMRMGIAYQGYYHRVKHFKYGPDYINTRLLAERTNGLTISVGFDLGFKLNLGYTIKFFESQFGLFENAKHRIGSNALAHDFGLIVEAPICEKILELSPFQKRNLSPFITPIFHISRRNVGSKLKYTDDVGHDPLPRQVYTGLAIKAGLAYNLDIPFDILHLHWAREVDDVLVHRTADGRYSYPAFAYDIDFVNNVVFGESNDQIAMHQGYEIGLADLLFIRGGRYDYLSGNYRLDTSGFGINFSQAVRLFPVFFPQVKSCRLMDICRLVDVEYHSSSWDAIGEEVFDNLKFNSVTISIKRP